MPVPTPDELRIALREHHRVKPACAAIGITLAGVRFKRTDGTHQHPDLVAVLEEYAAAGKAPRGAHRKLGEHKIALPEETVARLDRLAAARAAVVGPKRGTRAAIARELLEAALRGPLPPPLPVGRARSVVLDLGEVWGRIGQRLGTKDPKVVAGVVRAILTEQKIDTVE